MMLDDPQERSATAGEYVLGTLSPADREAVEQALAGNAALQAEVYYWQDRLLPLAERVQAEQPAPQLWQGIEARLGVVTMPTSASSSTAPAANDPMWQRLRRWRVVSGMAIAASVLLASLLVLRAPGPPALASWRAAGGLQVSLRGEVIGPTGRMCKLTKNTVL